ncbi:hypothetical protein [Sphingobium sp. TCM1]|uniref:hypothetical protein n=1 Tax=Sphingobium sp. TCM1 TaxID=453246 RepID=UPI0007F373C4|nr:hypothetical protein [Sphingobium sp. TCM1]OAN53501.1 hypothetical protein A7Q26_05640 [Sphingobium sp. TCM1]
MHVIVSRSRIAGTAPLYQYRALVPLSDVAADRRTRCVVLRATLDNERVPSTRLADVIAPDAWFERNLAVPCGLAARLTLVAKRVEALIIRTLYPEMTAELPSLLFALDHDPGDASCRVAIADLNAAFDRLAPDIGMLMAADLGLFQGGLRHAA